NASTPRLFVIDTVAPALPVLDTPIRGADTPSPVFLRWLAATDTLSGLNRYRIQIDTLGTFAGALAVDSFHFGTETTIKLSMDTYFWRIIAIDDAGNTVASSPESFRVLTSDTTRPESFPLTAPVHGTETTSVNVKFQWGNAKDSSPPITYRLIVDTDFAGSYTIDTMVTDTFVTVTLTANDTLFWRVIAIDVAGNTTVIGDSRVAVDTAPPGPASPVFPVKGERVYSPTLLSWNASSDSISGIARYRFQIDTSGLFTAPRVDSWQFTSADTRASLEAGVFYWRVLAYDELGNNSVSATETFTMAGPDTVAPIVLDSPLASPSVVSNTGTTTVVITITVDDSNAVSDVFVDLSPLGQGESMQATQVTDTIWTITVVFDSTVLGDTYDLKVKIIDPANNTSTTTIRIVVTDNTPSMSDVSWQPLREEVMAGNEISIISTYGDSYVSVRYEFRPSSGGTWQNVPSNRPNPDTQAPFWGIYWVVPDTLPDGSYDVRAVGTDKNGNTDPNPSYLRIKLNRVDSTVHEYNDGSTHIRRQQFNPYESGTIMIADGGTRFELPIGGVSETVWIRVTILDTAPAASPLGAGVQAPGGGAFRVFVREDGKRSFAKPFTLRIPYQDTDLKSDGIGQTAISEDRLALYWWDDVTHSWIKDLSCRVDAVNNVIICQVNHFTLFAVLAGQDTKVNLQSLIVYPNPYVPNDGRAANGTPFQSGDGTSGIIFDGLTAQATITVYNSAGRRVAEMSKNSAEGRFHWDARGDDGRELASGVYLAVMKSGAETVVKKVMIIR
ncbi:MAG: T9SS type A sorting domain-containing protein, partial [Candidatus Hydrogenedentota bacterium]